MSNEQSERSRLGSVISRYATHRKTSSGASAQTSASTWVAMVTAIIGGFVALSTYRTDVAKQIDQSVAKSFEMIGIWNGASLREPRARVQSYVNARRACDARLSSRDLTDDDFIRVLEFFDLVHACVDASLCDAETAQQFFAPHANFQWPVLERSVMQMRESQLAIRSDPNFGIGMKSLATEPVEAAPCNGNF